MKKPETKTSKDRTQIDVLFDICEGLNQSIGACGVLIHQQQNMQWGDVRFGLETTRDMLISRIQTTKITPVKSTKLIGIN